MTKIQFACTAEARAHFLDLGFVQHQASREMFGGADETTGYTYINRATGEIVKIYTSGFLRATAEFLRGAYVEGVTS